MGRPKRVQELGCRATGGRLSAARVSPVAPRHHRELCLGLGASAVSDCSSCPGVSHPIHLYQACRLSPGSFRGCTFPAAQTAAEHCTHTPQLRWVRFSQVSCVSEVQGASTGGHAPDMITTPPSCASSCLCMLVMRSHAREHICNDELMCPQAAIGKAHLETACTAVDAAGACCHVTGFVCITQSARLLVHHVANATSTQPVLTRGCLYCIVAEIHLDCRLSRWLAASMCRARPSKIWHRSRHRWLPSTWPAVNSCRLSACGMWPC